MFSAYCTFDAVAYFDRNGEQSFTKLLSADMDPDPEHLRGGSSYEILLLLKKSSQSDDKVTRPDIQTDRQTNIPKCITQHSFPGARVIILLQERLSF